MRESRWGEFVAVVGVTLLALALRLVNLAGQSLWVDEGITFARATLPWGVVISNLLAVGNQTPLYYALLRPWLALAGASEFALRFPSAWAATLTVPVVYVVGKDARDGHTGLAAAALLALSPFHVWYAREMRMYALGTLIAALMMWAFVRALRRPGWREWTLLALASSMAYVVHYFALTLAAAQFVVFLWDLGRLYPRLRRWVVAQALAVLPVAVWMTIAVVWRGTTRLGGSWIPQPSLLAPLYTFCNFSLGYEQEPSVLIVLGWTLFLAVFGLAFRYQGERCWRLALLTWIGVPVVATFLLSLHRPYYVDRYLTVALPGFEVWTAVGVMLLPRRWRWAVAGALLAISTLAVSGVLAGIRYQKEDWRSGVAQVREMAHPGDRLFVAAPEDIPVSAYYLEGTLPLDFGLPEPSSESRIWFLYRVPIESNHLLGEPAGFDLAVHADPSVRAWLVRYTDQILGEWAYPGLTLFLLGESPEG
jgi:mannosyltransferase